MSLILIVDDEPRMTASLKLLLSGHGWDIDTAGSGQEALSRLRAEEYDVVLLDMVMPDLDGMHLMRVVKARYPHTRVIIITGHGSVGSAVDCIKEGAFDYLTKPVNDEEMVVRIQKALAIRDLEKEKREFQQQWELSESKYQYLVQNSPDMIYTLGEDGRFQYVNGSFETVLGYQEADLVGRPFCDVVHPDDVGCAEGLLENCRDGGGVSSAELRFLSGRESTNGTLQVEIKIQGQHGSDGATYLGACGFAHDVSVRRKSEDELRRQNAYFQQLFENSPEAIVILDDRDRVINVNPGFESLFQYHRVECLDRDINELIVPEGMGDEARDYSRSVLDLGISRQDETTRFRKDGQPVEVSILGYPIHLDSGKKGLYAVFSNITDRRRSEEALQETLTKLRKAMGGIIHVMVSTVEARDPYTAGHQQRVAELSRSIAQKMGLSDEEVDGIRVAGSIHDLGKIKIPAEILSNPGKITSVEFDLIKIHPQVAYDILKGIDFARPVADIVYQHHERIDGTGYPRSIGSDEIRLEAKILTVADVVEAIASHRPYRPALGIQKALEEISAKKGVWYDEEVVDACLALFREDHFHFRA